MAVMFSCFIVGGYMILNFLSQMYVIWEIGTVMDSINVSDRFNELNGTPFFPRGPTNRSFYPQVFIDLVAGVMFLIAGLTIWHLLREEEIETLKEEMADIFLLPEEKTIIDELKKAGGEITQKELVNKTGLSKVKVHRVLNKLESKKMIKRYSYGMTKKIVIEKAIKGS